MEYHHRHMDHGPNGAPAQSGAPGPHWGYSGGWGAPAPRTSKRSHSESDDCDDVFSEESSKDAQCASPGGNGGDSCQLLTRKRRRGVIEKKRRDRINTSLTELKRLVPTAYEKQGSAKLEKAEILQLTVDHLKMLHAKGLDTFAYDPQRYAMDYHSIGFRECASEVARYLVSCEGLDIQDPLRLRLMSHLQCFAAQRELAAKSCANPWSYATPAQPYAAHGHPATLNGPHPSSLNAIPPAAPISNPIPSSNLIGNIPSHHSNPTHETLHNYTDISNSCPTSRLDATSSTAPSTSSTSSLTPLTTVAPSGSTLGYPTPAPHYPAPAPHYPAGGAYHHPPPPGHHQYNQNSSKPYRPWGAELAY